MGAAALLLLLVMLTSLSLNMCMARTGKIRRQLNWWHKHLAGMPRTGKMAIVVTDIEGYSGVCAAAQHYCCSVLRLSRCMQLCCCCVACVS